jgi:hypothetical protein
LAHLAVSCVALISGCSYHAGSGDVIVAAAIDRYVWYGSAKIGHSVFRKREEIEKQEKKKWEGIRARMLTRMLVRRFSNPTKLVLAPFQKRAERVNI